MGHHRGHPLTGVMELRPDHWSTILKVSPRDSKELRTDTDQRIETAKNFHIHYTWNFIPTSKSNPHFSHVESIPTRYSQPWVKCFSSYQNHATSLPTIKIHCCSCQICDHTHIYMYPTSHVPLIEIMPSSQSPTYNPLLIMHTHSH